MRTREAISAKDADFPVKAERLAKSNEFFEIVDYESQYYGLIDRLAANYQLFRMGRGQRKILLGPEDQGKRARA